MKKSKIIVPALAVLCLSTAAAVSGTVAWFSAGRDASIDVTSTVINPEGDLKVTLAAKDNCVTAANGTAITMATNSMLRDASVDLGTTQGSFKAYRAIVDAEGNPTSYKEVSATDKNTVTVAGNPTNVYYFATFSMTFQIPQAASGALYDIFFNPADSTKIQEKAPTEGSTVTPEENVQTAYRVGMYTSSKTLVWAPGHATGTALTYVKGGTTTDTYTNAVDGKVTNDDQSDAQGKNTYLGQITGTGELVVNAVVWYEGSDANAISSVLDALHNNSQKFKLAFNAIAVADYVQL